MFGIRRKTTDPYKGGVRPMTDKTKRIILIAAGVLLCAALVVGIVSRLAAVPMPIDPDIPDDTPNTKDPVVNISDPEVCPSRFRGQ